MHPPTFIHDVSFDCHTVPSTDEERRFQLYLLNQLTSYDHRERVSYKSLRDEGKRWVSSYPAWKLERGADLHDGRVMLELCIRRISNCEVDTHAAANDPEGVEAILSKLIIFGADHTASYHIFNCTPATKARALALILWTEFVSILNLLTSEDTGKRVMLRLLPHMALHADACARIDFLPPIVLRVAYWLSTFEQRFGVDARTLPMFAEREYLPSLWKVYGDYVQKQTAEELKRLAKVSKAPNTYRCAADGCGIQAIDRRALRKCGGECRGDAKTYYCSSECQVKHWFVHRYACKSSARGVIEDDGDPDWVDIETYKPHYDDDILRGDGFYANEKGAEIFIDVPDASPYRNGEVVRVRTKTLSPAFLRSYRASWKFLRYRDVVVAGGGLGINYDSWAAPPYDFA